MKNNAPGKKKSLRQRAEEVLMSRVPAPGELPEEEIKRLIYDLQVHQVELEMQNEELRRAQHELEESRTRYFDLYDFAPVGYFTLKEEGVITEVNLCGAKILGIERAYLVGKPFAVFLAPASQNAFHRHIKSIRSGVKRASCELKLARRRDGWETWVIMETAAGEGLEKECCSALTDISWRKKMEESLRLREAGLMMVLNVAKTSVFSQDRSLRYTDIQNPHHSFADIKVVGKTDRELLPPEAASLLTEIKHRVLESGKGERAEVLLHLGGDMVYYDLIVEPQRDEVGAITGITCASTDITEPRKAEEHLKTACAEKEMLLKELHHRVKNNLQTVSSLLSLQERQIAEPRLKESFDEIRNRIKSMTIIHDLLSCSENVGEVNCRKFLSEMAAALFSSQGRKGLSYNIKADEVSLKVDTAIPCALIVNELVTNAFKHAFPGSVDGEVIVEMKVMEKHRLRLTVSDDGVGLPGEESADKASSLGMSLVQALTEQINGVIVVKRDGGTAVEITFNDPAFSRANSKRR
ncbi:MAG: histidine kinase dimerization/phosphoacceptor domain -containing protein [Candidatus Eremiobacteraeota bacterium]|nr:histidine kinase dimerization/phosphoacceptor domain -containing protein [Candidatus Eremiobacteraeota bacterium]